MKSDRCCKHYDEQNPCDNKDCWGIVRYSLGIYAGRYCDKHWDESGYRKEGREGFDPAYAGETYDEDEWY